MSMPMMLPTSVTIQRYLSDPHFKDHIDNLFAKVEKHVDDFALSHEVLLIKWYRDLPIWVLRWVSADITRLINVGATQKYNAPALAVAVDAYRDDLENYLRHSLRKSKRAGVFREAELLDKLGLITSSLDKAFDIANELSDRSLTEERALPRL